MVSDFSKDAQEVRKTVFCLLDAGDFDRMEHQMIYRAIQKLATGKDWINWVTVNAYLKSQGQLDAVGGANYIYGLSQYIVPVSCAAPTYARKLKELSIRRQYIAKASEAARLGHDASRELAELSRRATDLAKGVSHGGGDGMISAADSFAAQPQDLESWQARRKGRRISTQFTLLDAMLHGGFNPGDLYVLGARPSVGKSALAICLSRAVLLQGKAVYFASYEMGEESLMDRMACVHGGIDGTKLATGELSEAEFAHYQGVCKELSTLPFHVRDQGMITLETIRADCQRVQASEDLGLVVVDYLQLMHGQGPRSSRVEFLGEMCNGLKSMVASEFNVPVLLLSQLSRNADNRGAMKRAVLSDLRESGEIEQAADVAILLNANDETDGEARMIVPVEVHVAKHRNGPTGRIKLLFQPNYTRFDQGGMDE
jgi:replicative DNA helicase